MRHSLRLTMACLAAGLTVAAFRIAKQPTPFLALAAVFCISCAARVQNDWRDRLHDVRKRKMLALEYPKLFLLSAILLWTLCFLLIGAVAWWSLTLALMLTAIALIGLIYSEMRRTPWMPICLSAIASASPALLPFAIASDFDVIFPLFAGAALLIFGREILKDVQDQEIDGGYKWTIPLAYGSQAAKGLVVASVAAASAAVATVSPLVIAGGLCAAVGVLLMCRNASPAASMAWLDAGAALVLATLAAFPP